MEKRGLGEDGKILSFFQSKVNLYSFAYGDFLHLDGRLTDIVVRRWEGPEGIQLYGYTGGNFRPKLERYIGRSF